MDELVIRGMAKWPNVPAVYGWLSLDRRGHWLLKGERVTNPGIAAFFGRNYSHDDQGRWFFQNGPQRVYVTLDYTPHVYRATSLPGEALALVSHSGTAATAIGAAYVDDAGQLLLDTDLGIGLLHDADLEALLPRFNSSAGQAGEAALAATLDTLQAGNHAGTAATAIGAAYVDDAGQLLLDTDLGIGLLHDADLEALLPRFNNSAGQAGEAALAATLDTLQAGNHAALDLDLGTTRIRVKPVRVAEVPARFGFVVCPVQPAGQEECY